MISPGRRPAPLAPAAVALRPRRATDLSSFAPSFSGGNSPPPDPQAFLWRVPPFQQVGGSSIEGEWRLRQPWNCPSSGHPGQGRLRDDVRLARKPPVQPIALKVISARCSKWLRWQRSRRDESGATLCRPMPQSCKTPQMHVFQHPDYTASFKIRLSFPLNFRMHFVWI
jgi:hypothetical protein